jgi:hypothetical protein
LDVQVDDSPRYPEIPGLCFMAARLSRGEQSVGRSATGQG